jgi:hypothetical protein
MDPRMLMWVHLLMLYRFHLMLAMAFPQFAMFGMMPGLL